MRETLFRLAAASCSVALCLSISAQETEKKTPDPGFRPDSEHADAFLEALETATVSVYPSIVRTLEETSYSTASQQQIVSLLNEKQVAKAAAEERTIDPGELKGEAQWGIFQNDMQIIAEGLKGIESDAEYSLVMTFLFPPGNRAVFGIHCYVFDRQGENAFSFLLNSHHELFVDANLSAEDASGASMAAMIKEATKVGVIALIQQIEIAVHQHPSTD